MRVLLYIYLTFFCLLASVHAGYCQQQEAVSTTDKVLQFPDKLFGKLNEKAASLNKALDRQTEKYLTKLSKQESKLRKKIAAKDSALAKQLFDGVEAKYSQLQKAPEQVSKYASVYVGRLDSLTTSLNFLKDNPIGRLAGNAELQKTLNSYKDLQSKLNASEQARKYIAERKQLLQSKLQELGMMKELNKFKRDFALYQSQVQEYRNILNEPSKIENALLGVLQKVPAFRDFFARTSLLGSMFALPTSAGTPANIPAGLQTRAMVNQNLIDRFGSMEAVTQALQQSMPAAQSQLQQLKDKLNQYKGGSYGNGGSAEMPDYKVNQERSKSFWKRVYVSAGMQSQKRYSILPVTSDISAAVNFKWSENKVIGIGMSEKIGWGTGWRNIKLTHQGLGIKSFLDIKLKGSFWLSGGYELNYRPDLGALDSAVNAAHGRDVNLWQKSGLIGVSKIVSLKGKVAKKTKVQVLWDYLSYSQRPRTPAVIWRVEYAFK
ncbi:MAG TPA: hypothetical protein VJ647_00440 [Chitinophagaceae bacterium]|nr:hypothetical protein [Chitinophagaceae bacterium]